MFATGSPGSGPRYMRAVSNDGVIPSSSAAATASGFARGTSIETGPAARAARAHDFITRLPDGYDSWIGERGVKLSVGQKQRVSIARVLLKDPPIVIFDEATSNIDTETEVKIREALNDLTKGRTTFIIAHRLATLHDVDRIVVVEQGTIVEEGNHDTLMKRGGVYAGLYEAQFKI